MKGRRRAVYATGISCTAPSRKISLYLPEPVNGCSFVARLDTQPGWEMAHGLARSCPTAWAPLTSFPLWQQTKVLTALFKPLNLQSLYFLFIYLCAAIIVCSSGRSFRSQFQERRCAKLYLHLNLFQINPLFKVTWVNFFAFTRIGRIYWEEK